MYWNEVDAIPPRLTKSADYMVFSPKFGGYLFRCSFSETGFDCDEEPLSTIDATHYRLARLGEVSKQECPLNLPEQ